jgi:protein-disulfide isomerase
MSDMVARPAHVPASATAEGDGVVLGSGPIAVHAYVDFLCPYCRAFELNVGGMLARLVAAGQITLAYHPMNFLDRASTTNYSSRAAAASGCASDAGRFPGYVRALFKNQPPEGGPGLTDAKLAELAGAAGLPETFAECLHSGRYLDWAPYVTALAVARGVQATPTVLVNGRPVPANARMISAAVADA